MIHPLILSKIDRTAGKMGSRFPHITDRGRWVATNDGGWTSGYWVGILWLAHMATDDEKYRELAGKWAKLLVARKKDKNPDLGHLFYPSFVLGYRVTGDSKLRKTALGAADTLTTCYNRSRGLVYRKAEVNGRKRGRALIDFMVNLPLLWWAHGETGIKKYFDVANRHSVQTISEFVRGDGSTFHALDFDLKTGQVLEKTTLQGYSGGSCWSRGQAWGVYGLVRAYEATKNMEFLNSAEKLADYFIKNLPGDFVPYWDFDPKIPNAPKDSSAAAIACSALQMLSEMSGKRRFGRAAKKILNSLLANYIAEENRDGILKHGCYHMPKKIGVDEGLIWGDYYFLEALMKSAGGPE